MMEDMNPNHSSSSGDVTAEAQTSLPRSIRWKIKLGLIQDRDPFSHPHQSQHQYLEELARRNETIIATQRAGYEVLADKHYRQSSALAIINDTESQTHGNAHVHQHAHGNAEPSHPSKVNTTANVKPKAKTKTNVKKVAVKNVVDDPLSLMASMEERKMKEDRKKEMDRKKTMIMASRPHMQHHPSSSTTTNVTQDNYNSNTNGNTNTNTNSKHDVEDNMTKTRWDDFYSSKDTMDLIEKDLDRMPINHHIYFHQRKMKQNQNYPQEQPQPIISIQSEEWNVDNPIMMQSRTERSKILSEILFVYAKEHSEIGYRQGMHEILSYILMTLEIDLMNMEDEQNRNAQPYDDRDPIVQQYLLTPSKLIHDTYCMFDAVMTSLAPSFEYGSARSTSQAYGEATMTIIREWYGDDELAEFVSNLDAPPDLYCTRWIRLMFSREVEGVDQVFLLWDEFLEHVGGCEESSSSSQAVSLMNVLETTAASMIIRIRDKLTPHHKNAYHYDNDHDEEDEPMHLLMNYSRMNADQCASLIDIFHTLMASQRSGIKPPKVHNMMHQSQSQMPAPHMNMNLNMGMNQYDYNNMPQPMYPNHEQQQQQQPNNNPMPQTNATPLVADTTYFAQGPVHYDFQQQAQQQQIQSQTQTKQPVDPTQQFMNNAMQQQEHLISTIKNLKDAPAFAKLSSGLNAMKGALQSIDLQSIDNPLKPSARPQSNGEQHRGGHGPTPDHNMYQPHPHMSQSMPGAGAVESNMAAVGSNEVFLGYRDVSTLPSIIDEPTNSLPTNHAMEAHPSDDFTTEGSFVGGGGFNNFIPQPHSSNYAVPEVSSMPSTASNTNATTVHGGVDLSSEISARMSRSIFKISQHLQSQPGNLQHNSSANDAWVALAELETMQRELSTLYRISLKE